MSADIEKRIVCQPKQELRVEAGEDGKTRITALAVPYGETSEDLGGFREIFASGAFSETISEGRDVFVDVEHDGSKKLGRRAKGSVVLNDTPDGLRYTVTLPNTTLGKDTAEEVRNGLLDGSSIAFVDPESQWMGKGKDTIRKVVKATLKAITLTSYPAYRQTVGTLAMRSLEEHRKTEEEAEKPAEPPAETTPDVLRMRCDVAQAENMY